MAERRKRKAIGAMVEITMCVHVPATWGEDATIKEVHREATASAQEILGIALLAHNLEHTSRARACRRISVGRLFRATTFREDEPAAAFTDMNEAYVCQENNCNGDHDDGL